MLGNVPDNRLTDDEYINLAAYGSVIDVLQANFLGFCADEGMIVDTTADGITPLEGVVDERTVFSGAINLEKHIKCLKASTSPRQEAIQLQRIR